MEANATAFFILSAMSAREATAERALVAVIGQWAYSLVRQTTVILLGKEPKESDLNFEIRKAIENDSDTVIADLHIWQVGVNKFAAVMSLVAHWPKTPEFYKKLRQQHEELIRVTVEVNQCDSEKVALAS